MSDYVYPPVVRADFEVVDEPIETPELTYEDFRNLAERYRPPQEWYEE